MEWPGCLNKKKRHLQKSVKTIKTGKTLKKREKGKKSKIGIKGKDTYRYIKPTLNTATGTTKNYKNDKKIRNKMTWKKKGGMTWLFKQKEEAPTKITENHQKPEKLKKSVKKNEK